MVCCDRAEQELPARHVPPANQVTLSLPSAPTEPIARKILHQSWASSWGQGSPPFWGQKGCRVLRFFLPGVSFTKSLLISPVSTLGDQDVAQQQNICLYVRPQGCSHTIFPLFLGLEHGSGALKVVGILFSMLEGCQWEESQTKATISTLAFKEPLICCGTNPGLSANS